MGPFIWIQVILCCRSCCVYCEIYLIASLPSTLQMPIALEMKSGREFHSPLEANSLYSEVVTTEKFSWHFQIPWEWGGGSKVIHSWEPVTWCDAQKEEKSVHGLVTTERTGPPSSWRPSEVCEMQFWFVRPKDSSIVSYLSWVPGQLHGKLTPCPPLCGARMAWLVHTACHKSSKSKEVLLRPGVSGYICVGLIATATPAVESG